MTKVAIVFFSGYGHTAKQAEAVADGVRSVSGVELTLLRIDNNGDLPENGFAILSEQDAVIYGSPTYMGGPAWQFKKFADASSKIWSKEILKDTIAAGFTNSASVNGDKFSTIQYQWTLSQQHGQIWVGLGLFASNKKENGPDDINWAGGFSGALAISPSDSSSDEFPRGGDLKTAEMLGKRVAKIAVQFKK